jgi:phage repressor protein C with HTH and peptisase S24 domain
MLAGALLFCSDLLSNTRMNIQQIRRTNLAALIAAAGSLTALARRTGISMPYLSQLKSGFRAMGSVSARKIEAALDLPGGVLDSLQQWEGFKTVGPVQQDLGIFDEADQKRQKPTETNAGPRPPFMRVEMYLADTDKNNPYMLFAAPVRSIEFKASLLRSLANGRQIEDLALVMASGDSMVPAIESQDVLLLDMSVTSIRADGIYQFQHNSITYVKRLQTVGDRVAVMSDNKQYETWYISASETSSLMVEGQVIAAIPFGRIRSLA